MIRWTLLLLVLPLAAVNLGISVVGLVTSATTWHQDVMTGTTRPAAGLTRDDVMRSANTQESWGIRAMTAVAAFAGSLVLTLIAWLLHGARARAARRGRLQ